jgi:hypothetical protein
MEIALLEKDLLTDMRLYLQAHRSFVLLADMGLRGKESGDMAVSIWIHLDVNAILEPGKHDD